MGKLSKIGSGRFGVHMSNDEWYKYLSDDEVIIKLKVTPGALRSEFVGTYGGELKVRLNAAPVDGKANKELIKFIASIGRCPKDAVKLLRGHKSKHKTIQCKSALIPLISECFE